jgi:hypothetical protein
VAERMLTGRIANEEIGGDGEHAVDRLQLDQLDRKALGQRLADSGLGVRKQHYPHGWSWRDHRTVLVLGRRDGRELTRRLPS